MKKLDIDIAQWKLSGLCARCGEEPFYVVNGSFHSRGVMKENLCINCVRTIRGDFNSKHANYGIQFSTIHVLIVKGLLVPNPGCYFDEYSEEISPSGI